MSFWGRYVPVAERRANAQKNLKKHLKKAKQAEPVKLEGKIIARSFWGKSWCDHLESFSDYENRLPRGRTYVRNGSVCHLEVQPGRIEAIVSGSSLYKLSIRIKELKASAWKDIKRRCAGQIGSMLELLQGKLSNQVMGIVTDRKYGLFPQPGEMELSCSCPDWAVMCKHVAAVLYGVGSRLDSQPELLFILRNVDAQELIVTDIAVPIASTAQVSGALAAENLGEIFGIDLDVATSGDSGAVPTTRKARSHAKSKQSAESRENNRGRSRKRPAPRSQKRASEKSRDKSASQQRTKSPSHRRKRPPASA